MTRGALGCLARGGAAGKSDRTPGGERCLPRTRSLVSNARMKAAVRVWGVVWVVAALASSACAEAPDPMATEYQGIVEFDERALSFEVPGKVQAVHVERGSSLVRYAVIA